MELMLQLWSWENICAEAWSTSMNISLLNYVTTVTEPVLKMTSWGDTFVLNILLSNCCARKEQIGSLPMSWEAKLKIYNKNNNK